MVGAATVAAPRPWHRQALVSVLCVWLVAAPLTTITALLSDWPPVGELPTAEQVRQARTDAWAAGTFTVAPAAVGLVLALLSRSAEWIATFVVGCLASVLVSGFLIAVADSPVIPG